MSTALLDLDSVSSAYGQSQVLWDIDLMLESGTITALIGRNGVGKSTLLKCISGVQPVTGGRVAFAGKDIASTESFRRAREGIGYVPQGRHIFPHLTVAENLTTGLAAMGKRGSGKAAVPGFVFDLFPKLHDVRGRKGGFLSGGEQQQLAIARALAGAPTLLLLDEPTEGIQPNIVQQIGEALETVRTELGITILIVEQYLDFVWRLADGYVAMQSGRIVQQGSTRSESQADVAKLVQI